MKKILVTFATMAGSTSEVAQAIGEELTRGGLQVDVLPVDEVRGLAGYDAVVVGGPMIMGWHRSATGFLRKYRSDFQHIPLAVFVLAMSLTQTGNMSVNGVEVFVDETLPKPPVDPNRLSFREGYARLSNYLKPILRAVHPTSPVSIGVFNGRMEYGRLKWWAVLFAMLIIRATAGDKRNWTAIKAWAASLGQTLLKDKRGA